MPRTTISKLLLTSLISLAPFAALAQPSFEPVPASIATTEDGRLQVEGFASRHVDEVAASLSFSIESSAELGQAQKAYDSVNEKLHAIRAALEAAGLAANDLTTSAINLSTRQDLRSKTDRIWMSYRMTIANQPPAKLGETIPALIAAGATGLSNFAVTPVNAEALRDTLSLEAAADARRRAQDYAEAVGLDITGIASLDPIHPSGPVAFEGAMMAARAAPMPIETGNTELTARVRASFTVRLKETPPQ